MLYRTTRWLLFATGISLPLSKFHAFDIAFLSFTVNKVVTAVLLGWAVIFWLATRRGIPKDHKLPWLAALAVAMAISVLTAFLGGSPISAVLPFIVQLGSVILFYLLILYIVLDMRCLDTLLWGYILGSGIASISVLLGYGLEFARTGGLGGDPNHYAYHAVIGLAIILMYFTIEKSVPTRGLLVGLGVVSVLGIMTSLSRGGAIAAAAVFGFWMLRMGRLDALRVLIPAGVLAVTIMFFASPDWVGRMGTIRADRVEELDTSTRTRIVVGEYSLRAFISNPIFGVGYTRFGNWSVQHMRQLRVTGQADALQGTEVALLGRYKAIHNAYLHVAAELGLMGLIPYLALVALSWLDYSRAWRLARRFPGDPILSRLYACGIFLQIGLLGALVDNLVLSSLRFKGQWLLLGLSAVVLILTRQRIGELKSDKPTEGLPEVPSLPGVGGSAAAGSFEPAYESPSRR